MRQAGKAFQPNVDLAKLRIAEGFAFAGLTDQWALSMCLFARKFHIPCLPMLFTNSRATHVNRTRPGGTTVTEQTAVTPSSVYKADPRLYSIFADEHADGSLYRFVKRRFVAEAAAWNITHERCATTICPQAAQHFRPLSG